MASHPPAFFHPSLLALPLGELSPKVTERACRAGPKCPAAPPGLAAPAVYVEALSGGPHVPRRQLSATPLPCHSEEARRADVGPASTAGSAECTFLMRSAGIRVPLRMPAPGGHRRTTGRAVTGGDGGGAPHPPPPSPLLFRPLVFFLSVFFLRPPPHHTNHPPPKNNAYEISSQPGWRPCGRHHPIR